MEAQLQGAGGRGLTVWGLGCGAGWLLVQARSCCGGSAGTGCRWLGARDLRRMARVALVPMGRVGHMGWIGQAAGEQVMAAAYLG